MHQSYHFNMERHSSNAMFISEIPVRCMSTSKNTKIIKWIGDLNKTTTVRDIIQSIYPKCDPMNYLFYIHLDDKKQILKDSSFIYKIVEKINRKKSASRRLLFEICLKKRVRFADEICVQNIIQRQCLSDEKFNNNNNIIETISMPLEKRLEKIKENFQKHIYQKQEYYKKTSTNVKRQSLHVINENIPHSSSESGISSNLSTDDLFIPTKPILETLV